MHVYHLMCTIYIHLLWLYRIVSYRAHIHPVDYWVIANANVVDVFSHFWLIGTHIVQLILRSVKHHCPICDAFFNDVFCANGDKFYSNLFCFSSEHMLNTLRSNIYFLPSIFGALFEYVDLQLFFSKWLKTLILTVIVIALIFLDYYITHWIGIKNWSINLYVPHCDRAI